MISGRHIHPPSTPVSNLVFHNPALVMNHSPVSHNLYLRRVCSKKLYILIMVVQERYDKPPCFWSLLKLKEFVLQRFNILRGCCWWRWCVCLLNQLQKGSNKILGRSLSQVELELTSAARPISNGETVGRKSAILSGVLNRIRARISICTILNLGGESW